MGRGSTPVSVPATVRGNLSTGMRALLGVRSGLDGWVEEAAEAGKKVGAERGEEFRVLDLSD